MILAWLEFLACAALILAAGTRLSHAADAIADATGLTRSFIGFVLLATVTSLPEVASGVSAAWLVHEPDLAVGNVLGACVVNLAMIAVLDLLYRRATVYAYASQGHILSAAFSVIMFAFAGFNILLGPHASVGAIGHVGLASPVMVLLYAVALRAVYRYEHRDEAAASGRLHYTSAPGALGRAVASFAGSAVVVVAAATALPYVARDLAGLMGWQQTFVGTLLLALVTTLPEMAVTFGALRLGQIDMAIGNLLGSNLFNVTIIALADVAYSPGPILADVSTFHAVSAMAAILMSAVVIAGILYRPEGRVLRTVGWASLVLLASYVLNSLALFLYAD